MGTSLSTQVGIIYSHKDRAWQERFQTRLRPLVHEERLTVWDDTMIAPGTDWEKTITNELSRAKVALLLVSPYFLISPFIRNNELPLILEATKQGRVTVFWVLLSPCFYEISPVVKYQPAHDISRALESLSVSRRNETIMHVCRSIRREIQEKKLHLAC